MIMWGVEDTNGSNKIKGLKMMDVQWKKYIEFMIPNLVVIVNP
jgi:hypothetical protein